MWTSIPYGAIWEHMSAWSVGTSVGWTQRFCRLGRAAREPLRPAATGRPRAYHVLCAIPANQADRASVAWGRMPERSALRTYPRVRKRPAVDEEGIVSVISVPQAFNEEDLYVDLKPIFGHGLFL